MATPTPEGARSSLEQFEPAVIHRSEAKNAPYNPRVISADARRRLKAGIKKRGILQPIVWNRRSGNIVGGHQRVSIMDQLHGSADYQISVAAVDLDEAAEMEANLLLNNVFAMGDFDLGKLEAMVKMPELDMEAAGFDRADLYRMFGSESSLAELEPEKAQEMAESIRKTADEYQANMQRSIERDSTDYYLVVVFKSYAERKAFTEQHGLEDNRYQSAEALRAALAPED